MLLLLFSSLISLVLVLNKVQAQRSCTDYRDFIYAGPQIHGKVPKGGTLPAQHWWNVPFHSMFHEVKDFLQERNIELMDNKIVQNGMIQSKTVKIPQSEVCQIFISHDYKLIYVKIPKTSGSSLIRNFQRNCRVFEGINKKECINANFVRPSLEDIPDLKTAQEMWKDYFVFTGVRNPYSRGASMYAYLLGRRSKLGTADKEGCTDWPTFGQFCKAPYIIPMHSEKYDCVSDKTHDYLHIEPQAPYLMDENGKFVVDYILSLENIKEDYEQFKQALLNRPGLNQTQQEYFQKFVQLEYQHRNAVSGGNAYAQKMFRRCGDSCVANLAAYYSDDFKLLGYENCVHDY